MNTTRSILRLAFLLGALAILPATASAQCGSTVQGTNGNPFPLTIGAESACTANSLQVPATSTTIGQSNVTPLGCGASQQRDIWFTFTATSGETVLNLYNANSSNNGFMVYEGPCGTTMNLVGCAGYNQHSSMTVVRAVIPTVPGTTYYVRVSRGGSNSLPSGLRICGWNLVRPPDHPVCEASFESGNTAGWTCRYGAYGAPAPFSMQFPNAGCLNPGGPNALMTANQGGGGNQAWNAGNRHTIMGDKNYFDPRTLGNVPVVAPGGGNYSFRLGNNDYGCGVPGGTPCPAQAESISFDLAVTQQNAGFTYMFSAILLNPSHAPDEQPRFEALVTDVSGNVVNCGYFLFVAGSGLAQFRPGAGDWEYTEWTEVGMDLTAYIGQTVRIEFRVSGCYPASGGTSCSCSNNNCTVNGVTSGGVVYNCTNVTSCTPTNPATNPNCTPQGGGNNNAGVHSAYAYIDTYCKPLTVETPEVCAGTASIQICAPAGYRNYIWQAGQPGLVPPLNQRCVTVNNPEPGTRYRVDMELITGCPTFTFVEILGIPVTTTDDVTICPGESVNLSVSVNTPSAPPYTFQWSPGGFTGPGPHVVTPAQTTTYSVTTTNGNGCSSSKNITVTVDNCVHTVNTTGGSTCPGGCVDLNATHTPGPSGSFPPYTYTWSHGPAGAGPHQVCPSATTVYTVTVTDGNGATATATVTAVVHPQPTVGATHTNARCYQGSDGTVTATPAGGTPPFTYQWNTTPPQTGATATGLPAGPYTVTTTDANGCTAMATATVGEPPELLPTTSTTPADCGAADGTATVTPAGGTGPYTIRWNTTPPQTTPTATNLVGGNYDVTVTDANGCSRTVTAIVGQTGVADLSTTQVDVTCNGGNDGSATVAATGGNPPFAYSWNTTPPQTGTTANNLTAGTWTVSVTDAIGCVTTIQVTITEPTAIVPTASATPANCGQSNGATNVSATGGTPPYTYAWNTTPAQTTPTASGIPAGTYTVTITDANGCTAAASIVVNDIPGPVAGFVFSDVCLGSPVVFTNTSSGQSTITSGWDLGDGTTSLLPGPTHVYTTPGTYTVTLVVVDAAGCTASVSRNVTIYPIPEVDFSGPASGCAPVTTTFINNAPIPGGTCVWNLGDGTTSSDCNGPTHTYPNAGCYDVTLTVTSPGGCSASRTEPGLVCVSAIPVADFTISPNRIPDTRPFVNFINQSRGGDRFRWEFFNGDSVSILRDPSMNLMGVDPGRYDACLWAINSAGCVDSICKVFTITTDLLVYVPNAFSPDGDGINEIFIPIITGYSFEDYEFMIFNRWGELIFETNNPTMGWNGFYNGVMSKSEVYVWKLKVKPEEGTDAREFIGHVTLLR